MNDKLGGTPEPEQPPTGSDDPFNVILDEAFVQGASAKEQSARARELAAKWAKQPPTQTNWRSDGPPTDAWSEAKRKQKKRRKMRVPMRNAVIFVITAAIAAAVLYPRHHTPPPFNATPAGTVAPQPSSASPSPSYANPDDKYFADSPSLSWADNADGIVAPDAAKLGSFSAAQVADGYASMKKLLIAGNLDATILNGGSTADFADLLDPVSKLPGDLDAWLKSPAARYNPTNLVSRFNPATTRLLGHIVKVNGSMSAKLDKNGDLLITGDYKFVYAVGPADGSAAASRTVVSRTYQIWIGRPGLYSVTAGKLWISDYWADIANSACFEYNGFINPTFGQGDARADPNNPVDPYASAQPSTSPSPSSSGSPQCNTVSRL